MALAAAFILSRVFLFTIGIVVLKLYRLPMADGADALFRLMNRWDARWYLQIAETGYSAVEHPSYRGQTTFGFFPAFPILLRGAAWLFGQPLLVTGVVLSNAFCLAALLLVFEYAKVLGLRAQPAVLAGILISFAPQSFVFSAPYTESLFFFLLVSAMLAWRTGAYGMSALAAAVLSSIRVNGVFFILFSSCAVLRRDRLRTLCFWLEPARFLPIIASPLGLFAYWWFCYRTTGDAFASASTLDAGWHWVVDWPWMNIGRVLLYGQSGERFGIVWSLSACSISMLLLRYGWYEEFVLCAPTFLLGWLGTVPDSLVRHTVVLFPIFIVLARSLDHKPWRAASVLIAFATIDGALMAAWTLEKAVAI